MNRFESFERIIEYFENKLEQKNVSIDYLKEKYKNLEKNL